LTGVEPLFEGPSALILGQDGADVEAAAIAASRVVEAWRKQSGNELPVVKGGFMEGEVLDANQAKALAKLPTKAELQSKLLAQILSPGAKLSGQLVAGGSRIAGAIKSHIEKLESGS
jgi:large subunit ribosomal protein L10